jgi:hypothetical protein
LPVMQRGRWLRGFPCHHVDWVGTLLQPLLHANHNFNSCSNGGKLKKNTKTKPN